jgi:oxygen-independent coproporphyrinogen III oxidase
MAGIYIHIPFCRQACNYCNFYFTTQLQHTQALVNAICLELKHRNNFLPQQAINTIYFGGGTPGLLQPSQLQQILNTISQHYSMPALHECTIEVNPDDMSNEKLIALRQMGFDRLSVGVQSFYEEDLQYMNRAHNALQASNCITEAHNAGFNNISLDLIYGYPLLTQYKWERNLSKAKALGVTHLSCYNLTVEPNTALHHQIAKGVHTALSNEQGASQFEYLQQWALANNFQHYEISNLCTAGKQAIHNTSYWQGTPYIGIGPSAAGYNGSERYVNTAHIHQYIQQVNANNNYCEVEKLSNANKANEIIMTGLRVEWGIDKQQLLTLLTLPQQQLFEQNLKQHAQHLLVSDANIILKPTARLLADGIAADLFI